MNSTTTLQPQDITQKKFTILEDSADTNQLGVLVGTRFIGFILQDIEGGFYPIYAERGDNLECGDIASMAETAAQQLLDYRHEVDLEPRPSILVTKDERKIPISYGKPALATELGMISGRSQGTLVRGIKGTFVSID